MPPTNAFAKAAPPWRPRAAADGSSSPSRPHPLPAGRRARLILLLLAFVPFGAAVLVATRELDRTLPSGSAARGEAFAHMGVAWLLLAGLALALAFALWRAQTEILRRERRLARLEAERAQLELFAYAASHDLQEPAQKMLALAGLVRAETRPGPAAERHLERMEEAGKRLLRMLDDLREFARLDPRRPHRRVDLDAVLAEALRLHEAEIRTLGASMDAAPLPAVRGDARQLTLLFSKLLSNALKYRVPGRAPRIRVRAAPAAPGWTEVQVQDEGIGFDQALAEKAFTPFKRLHARGASPGSGLGLAICRRVALLHGGDIRASSRPGHGSVFMVRLPVARPGEV